jgi:radical SAM protein with 4Fe4S-binding SPASM domain
LRDDFFELLDEVKRLKLAVNIFTNGQMPEENIRRLADYYPATVGVSVYSANPEIHDATTRIKGSFEKSVKALKILHELGVRTQMKSPLMNHTVHGYKELLKLCDELGAIPQFDLTIIAATDGNQNVLKHQVCDTEVLSQVFRDPRLALYVGLDAAEKGRRTAPVDGTLCGAGCTSLSIAPDGSVYVCDSLPIVLGNVRDGGLKTVWENSKPLKQWRNITTQDTNECGLYQKCSYCNYCPGAALLAKNDIFDISESVCRIAEVRRDVAMNLEKGNDPLKEYLQKHGKPFGNDLTFHKPAEGDLPNVEINHSGENFVKRVNEIKRNGNAIRKTKHYEPDSPMDLYNHGELRKNQDSGHFLETGR